MYKTFNRAVAAGSLALVTMGANAAAIDVADVATDIGAQLLPIGILGGAVLLVYVAVKAFKWVRASMS